MKKKVYISGPVSNSPHYCEEFDTAEYNLRGLDYIVLNPVIFPLGLWQKAQRAWDWLQSCNPIHRDRSSPDTT